MPSPLLTHVHTLLVAAAVASTFPSLVATPPSTLLSTLPFLALLQTAYAALCLPRRATPKRKKPAAASPWTSTLLSLSLALALSLTLGSTALFAILIAFGAPLTTHTAHTFALAAHLALLAVFPLVARHGVDAERWREVVAVGAEVEEAFAGAVGACVGAWLGAVPIPLDWDREWQKWPVTILVGAYAGYLGGKTLGSLMAGRGAEKRKRN